MLKEEFGELDKLRKLYRKKKTQKLEKQRALQECRNTKTRTITKLRQDLKYKRAELLQNKELRTEAGLSNQKDWQLEIEKRTQTDEDTILLKENKYDEGIRELETCIEDLQLEISDIHWELTIKLEYYKDSPTIREVECLETIAIGE